jgi:hypothetical protein
LRTPIKENRWDYLVKVPPAGAEADAAHPEGVRQLSEAIQANPPDTRAPQYDFSQQEVQTEKEAATRNWVGVIGILACCAFGMLGSFSLYIIFLDASAAAKNQPSKPYWSTVSATMAQDRFLLFGVGLLLFSCILFLLSIRLLVVGNKPLFSMRTLGRHLFDWLSVGSRQKTGST